MLMGVWEHGRGAAANAASAACRASAAGKAGSPAGEAGRSTDRPAADDPATAAPARPVRKAPVWSRRVPTRRLRCHHASGAGRLAARRTVRGTALRGNGRAWALLLAGHAEQGPGLHHWTPGAEGPPISRAHQIQGGPQAATCRLSRRLPTPHPLAPPPPPAPSWSGAAPCHPTYAPTRLSAHGICRAHAHTSAAAPN